MTPMAFSKPNPFDLFVAQLFADRDPVAGEPRNLLDLVLAQARTGAERAVDTPTFLDYLLGRRAVPQPIARMVVTGAIGFLAYAVRSVKEERQARRPRLLSAAQLRAALARAEGGPDGYTTLAAWFNASPEERARLEALAPGKVASWRAAPPPTRRRR